MVLFSKHRKLLLGVVHLQSLPGSPGWASDLDHVIDFATRDALAYEKGGADALCLENFWDVPFTKGAVGPETVAALAALSSATAASRTRWTPSAFRP